MKQLIVFATIIALAFSGTVKRVGEISAGFPTEGQLDDGLSFYMMFDTPLAEGDIIRIVTPNSFKHYGAVMGAGNPNEGDGSYF